MNHRILLVDDQPVVSIALSALIEAHESWIVAGKLPSCDAALTRLRRDPVDLVVLEIGLENMAGLTRLDEFCARAPVLCFSIWDEQVMAERCLREGARGYLMKSALPEEVVGAMRSVLDGRVALSAEMNRSILSRLSGENGIEREPGLEVLSNRELQIVHHIGFNRNCRQIARLMHLSEKTIATHRLRIREKLALRSTNELIRIAARWTQQEALS